MRIKQHFFLSEGDFKKFWKLLKQKISRIQFTNPEKFKYLSFLILFVEFESIKFIKDLRIKNNL